MKKYLLQAITISIVILQLLLHIGCKQEFENGTFGSDLAILREIDDLQILSTGDAMVAVSGKLQGRVFTSSSRGLNGKSYGWFKKHAILDGTFKQKYSNLGGEDRMWFGPQFGKYSLFYEPGVALNDENLRTPIDLDTVNFNVLNRSPKVVKSTGVLRLKNYQNEMFKLETERKISILDKKEIETALKINIAEDVSHVAFETVTKLKNIGAVNWSRDKGLISTWILGCMQPTDSTVIIIPTKEGIENVTNYFSQLEANRMQIKNGTVYYRADANYLNKIGILPENTIPVFGAYSPELNLLTIVQFTFHDDPLYMNSQKGTQDDPYGGDVINIFNDGVTPTAGPFGPFYELESSSSAKELKVGEGLGHTSKTYHFEGPEKHLNELAQDILGVGIADRVIF